LSKNGKITIVYSDMMLMSKHCSSIYFRCQTTVLAFTLSVKLMLLLTDLTSVPDDKSTVLASNIAKKYLKKYCRYPYRYCIRKVSPILAPILIKYHRSIGSNTNTSDIDNPGNQECFRLKWGQKTLCDKKAKWKQTESAL